MTPDNLRYRSVKDALDSELANRRSRDYGDLVRKYNEGKASTQQLVDWVNSALKGIDPQDPDYQNWVNTQSDLAERVKTEKDQQVYQDYQQGRMKPDAFLAYLTTRRDAFDPTSPQFADWSNKLEDAQKQVKNDALAKQDSAFFNAYSEGHKSDTQYLTYIKQRIDGMDPNDPNLPEWQHKLNQASFSIAEDQLRFAVQTGKAPVSKLATFYKNYQRTLNPGSAEYRTIARALLSLGSGGGGGGGGGSSSGTRQGARVPDREDHRPELHAGQLLPLLRIVGSPSRHRVDRCRPLLQRAAEADRKAGGAADHGTRPQRHIARQRAPARRRLVAVPGPAERPGR